MALIRFLTPEMQEDAINLLAFYPEFIISMDNDGLLDVTEDLIHLFRLLKFDFEIIH